MSAASHREAAYGEPDLQLAGLSLWIFGRERPDDEDYWDGNWLRIRAVTEAAGARIEASGPWLRTDELQAFADELDVLCAALEGRAELRTMEPVLKVSVIGDRRGRIELVVELTPDHLTQTHRFEFELDQTYLKPAISACRGILNQFPVRGAPG